MDFSRKEAGIGGTGGTSFAEKALAWDETLLEGKCGACDVGRADGGGWFVKDRGVRVVLGMTGDSILSDAD